MSKLRLAVLISGSGNNLQNLINNCKDNFPADIVCVISNNPGTLGVKRAQDAGLPVYVINNRDYDDPKKYEDKMDQIINMHKANLVCLAGYMRVLSPFFVDKWYGKLINMHPSLLPAFRGANAPGQAFKAGVRIAGCTVHYVNNELDAGPIIVQHAVPVLPTDDEAALKKRILEEAEFPAYVEAIRLIAEGKVRLQDGMACWS